MTRLHIQKSSNSNGFTLIELMLAMTFLSLLLLAIAMLTIQMSNIFTRGVTMRQVNAVGSEISNDLQRSIQGSAAFEIVSPNGIDTENNRSVVIFEDATAETGGRLCLGEYSYAWNYGPALERVSEDANNPNKIDEEPVRFVKVADGGRLLCKTDPDGKYIAISDKAVDMLADADRNIAIQDVSLGSNRRGLYHITLRIGTNDQTVLTADGKQCLPPGDLASDLTYCAVNEFDIVAKAGSIGE